MISPSSASSLHLGISAQTHSPVWPTGAACRPRRVHDGAQVIRRGWHGIGRRAAPHLAKLLQRQHLAPQRLDALGSFVVAAAPVHHRRYCALGLAEALEQLWQLLGGSKHDDCVRVAHNVLDGILPEGIVQRHAHRAHSVARLHRSHPLGAVRAKDADALSGADAQYFEAGAQVGHLLADLRVSLERVRPGGAVILDRAATQAWVGAILVYAAREKLVQGGSLDGGKAVLS
mmetsp:Transcript_40689/g.121364  ORF Transcript_40689/g.121364 Transcript_40689/m.121364 type:complete len:231 (-) Transcript_40689:299-991(-)